ncbi:Nif3-like dinuclear metal center hexameric protein [Thermosulfurimonas marina]|uniref:GTP cyclohydrolase 1 type 2 homolog n=1 Tax=Thermosulfurimonas marina TaxID=2047767 RepID=A0A6H1WSW3_9BACT|nr:Nif3-like dinuclear metal center hexameric protein [Thermosulfurimonas marina]QJA06261.1 Nif3-like dinuclear metal center hexameric protein [Thermosulfurimonas marina]
MEIAVEDICQWVEEWAPAGWAEEWDNVGLQFGSLRAPVRHLGLALELTPAVAKWVREEKIDCLLTHHPVFFRPLKRLSAEDPWEALILGLIREGVTVVSYHTNLDVAPGGVTEALGKGLGLRMGEPLRPRKEDPRVGLGRLAEVPEPLSLAELAERLARLVKAPVFLVGEGELRLRRVALCAGSGMDLLPEVLQNQAQAFITGDVKHHAARVAEVSGVALVVSDHYALEEYFWQKLARKIAQEFPAIRVSYFRGKGPFQQILPKEA